MTITVEILEGITSAEIARERLEALSAAERSQMTKLWKNVLGEKIAFFEATGLTVDMITEGSEKQIAFARDKATKPTAFTDSDSQAVVEFLSDAPTEMTEAFRGVLRENAHKASFWLDVLCGNILSRAARMNYFPFLR